MKLKKLLVDAHTFDEKHQGIRTFLKGVYTAINVDSNELQIFLLAYNIDNLKQEFKHQKNFNFIKLKSKNKYERLAYEIPKLIKKHQFDFAHFNYYLPLFLSKNCKYIVTIHDVLFIDFPQYFPLKYRLLNTYMFKRSALKCHTLTTVSNYSADRIRYHFNTGDKRIVVLPNAINEKYLEERDKTEDFNYIKKTYNTKNYILYVSRLEPRKNHYKLLEVYRDLELWKQDLDVVLIGKESFVNHNLNQIINDINFNTNGRVIRMEDISNKELIKFYNAAQLAVFISLCEGFGIPPIESAVLKTPTICSNVTALKDFDFFANYYIDPSSNEQISNKILEILETENKHKILQQMEQISHKIKKKYNWSKTALILKNEVLNIK